MTITDAPDGADRPAGVAVIMPVGAAGRRHDHPSAIGGHKVADVVVREIVAMRFGHSDVVPRTTDRQAAPEDARFSRAANAERSTLKIPTHLIGGRESWNTHHLNLHCSIEA
jgi:hypothetical protein